MPASIIPSVTNALLTMFTTAQATTLAGVEVIAGPPALVPAGIERAIAVGSDWSPDEAIVATSTFAPYSDYAQIETVLVPVAVMAKTGDVAATSATTTATAILDAIKTLLVADPTLGGVVGYSTDVGGGGKAEPSSLAQFASITWRRAISGAGARAVVNATLTAAAIVAD